MACPNPEKVYPKALQQQPNINNSPPKKAPDFSFHFISNFENETNTTDATNYNTKTDSDIKRHSST